MRLGAHMALMTRRGLSEIDRDRDRALTFEACYGGSPALDRYLQELAGERALQLLMIDGVEQLRRANHPALDQRVRPAHMAKASLRASRAQLRTGTER